MNLVSMASAEFTGIIQRLVHCQWIKTFIYVHKALSNYFVTVTRLKYEKVLLLHVGIFCEKYRQKYFPVIASLITRVGIKGV